ncbi:MULTISPECIES: DUF3592 domain-containing protein [unclassified Lacinutrix]|uniref:DUF3592 domain-containing protein n=1 Tax=unclassified Lacinutrix TaxID=2647285 RepID=UPI00020A35E4|nr:MULTISPECIES: DUF3592 domain-containing protein [unclassified Lacinutrix]AEH02277.1 hypothetical protein Lacal_2435 [Lacinutrix sp. 5H-3-7-4]OIQ23890.1 MAG: hypothetical protein BM549_00870 [Lacinutrix sp. MedPE-SW]
MKLKYLFIVLGLIGITMLLVAFYKCINTFEFLSKSNETEGEIIEIVSTFNATNTSDQSLRVLYKPLIRFYDLKGNPIEFHSPIGSKLPKNYNVGDKITILYNTQDPKKAVIKSFSSLWSESILLGIFGIILISIAIVFFVLSKKIAHA